MHGVTIVFTLLGYLASTQAAGTLDDPFWVVKHVPLLSARLDPVISPGGVSGHVHQLLGSSSLAPTYSYENAMNGSCTTANAINDMSNYWAPQMYRKQAGGGFRLTKLSYANIYYQMRRTVQNGAGEPVYEFPKGFRMLAGSATRSTYDENDPAQRAVAYVCLNFKGTSTTTHSFPEKQCPDGIRAQVYFPHCWDGINNWLEGSKHVSYGMGGGSQFDQGDQCPPTHPKRIMGVFFEFIYDDSAPYVPGQRVLANGDDLGYSFHGDFTNGWPVGFFNEIFSNGPKKCTVEFSLEKCPALAPYLNDAASGACRIDPSVLVVDEDIGDKSTIAKLPGNNPVWGLSGAKVPGPNYVEKAQFKRTTPSLPSNWQKVGCMKEATGTRALKGSSKVDAVGMTPGMCMSFCASGGYSLAGIEYGSECYCDNTVTGSSLTSLITTAGACGMPCPGMSGGNGYCGDGNQLSVYKYIGTGKPSYTAPAAQPDIAPSGTGTPAQITANPADILMRTVKGDPVYTGNATLPAVTGGAIATSSTVVKSNTAITTTIAKPTSLTKSTSSLKSTTISTIKSTPTLKSNSSTTSKATSAATSKSTSSAKSTASHVSAAAVNGVLLAGAGVEQVSTASPSATAGESCKRSRRRALKEFVGMH